MTEKNTSSLRANAVSEAISGVFINVFHSGDCFAFRFHRKSRNDGIFNLELTIDEELKFTSPSFVLIQKKQKIKAELNLLKFSAKC